jgi:ribonucleoside-diphosphate reductase alpha chain
MPREELPSRRAADVVSFEYEGRTWSATFGWFADGRLGEVFLSAWKDSHLAAMAQEAAILASLALQFGCPLATLKHALAGRDAGPIASALALVAEAQT